MRDTISKRLTVAGLLIAWLVPVYAAQGQRRRAANGPVNVNELNRRKVIGTLGLELGTIVTIEGIVADESYRRERSDVGETLLRVQSVNGNRLKHEVVFPFMKHEIGSVATPTVGARFKFTGYETGGFVGEPNGVFDYVPRFAATSYHFRTSFYVLKDAKDE